MPDEETQMTKRRNYSARDVVQAMAGQAEAQTERTGKMLASAIGAVLARLGETQITLGPDDLAETARRFRVEIVGGAAPSTFTYKLVKIAPDDPLTGNLL